MTAGFTAPILLAFQTGGAKDEASLARAPVITKYRIAAALDTMRRRSAGAIEQLGVCVLELTRGMIVAKYHDPDDGDVGIVRENRHSISRPFFRERDFRGILAKAEL